MFGGEMVEEYIQKIYEGTLKRSRTVRSGFLIYRFILKETQAMIHLLEETNDP